MKWFRFYSEVAHDPKVQTLNAELFRAWINLLCLANDATPRGHLPSLRQVAYTLRVKEDRASQIIGQLVSCGLIDADESGSYQPHNWEHRQRNSDDVTSRVRQHRSRRSAVSGNSDETDQETTAKRNGNAPTEERRGETEAEQPPLPPGAGGAAAAVLAPLPSGAELAIETARDRFGDPAAELVKAKAATIDAQLGGRFDLFLEALDAASHHEPPLKHVFPWCMARAKARINQPPREANGAAGKLAPADRGAAVPAEAESKACPHCSGMGQVTVFHPSPDPARRIPGVVAADCVCPRGRLIRSKRDAETVKRVPDLADVLAGRSVWRLESPGANGTY